MNIDIKLNAPKNIGMVIKSTMVISTPNNQHKKNINQNIEVITVVIITQI